MPHMVHGLWVTLPVTRIAAERVIGGNLDQHDRDAVRVLDPHLDQPHGSVAGPRRTRTPAAASRSCSACTSRTWSQIITESPGEPAGRRTPPAIPGRERTPPRDQPERRTPGRSPNPAHRGRNGGFGRGRRGATESGCSIPPRNHPGSLPCPVTWTPRLPKSLRTRRIDSGRCCSFAMGIGFGNA